MKRKSHLVTIGRTSGWQTLYCIQYIWDVYSISRNLIIYVNKHGSLNEAYRCTITVLVNPDLGRSKFLETKTSKVVTKRHFSHPRISGVTPFPCTICQCFLCLRSAGHRPNGTEIWAFSQGIWARLPKPISGHLKEGIHMCFFSFSLIRKLYNTHKPYIGWLRSGYIHKVGA